MVKMDIRKIEDMTKRMEGEDSLIEMRYRTTICNDCWLKPATYFIVKGLGYIYIYICYPDYTYADSYVCISCNNRYDGLSAFGLEAQDIVEVYYLQSSSTVGYTSPKDIYCYYILSFAYFRVAKNLNAFWLLSTVGQ